MAASAVEPEEGAGLPEAVGVQAPVSPAPQVSTPGEAAAKLADLNSRRPVLPGQQRDFGSPPGTSAASPARSDQMLQRLRAMALQSPSPLNSGQAARSDNRREV
uniref:Uncharacterized protein n=1 Tax=Alexandrium andersonii TaxID=327968 RepID=A0A7S2MG84_9DINO